MRIQPPPTPNRWSKAKHIVREEIPEYFKAHVVVGYEDPIPVLEFLEILIMDEPGVYKSWNDFLSMWPDAYHDIPSEVFFTELLRIWKKKEEKEDGTMG